MSIVDLYMLPGPSACEVTT